MQIQLKSLATAGWLNKMAGIAMVNAARLIVMMGVLSLSGCSTPVVYTDGEKFSAAAEIVKTHLMFSEVVSYCEQAGDDSMLVAAPLSDQWWQKNWRVISLADKEFSRKVEYLQRDVGEYAGYLHLLEIEIAVADEFKRERRNFPRTQRSLSLVCERWLSAEINRASPAWDVFAEDVRLDTVIAVSQVPSISHEFIPVRQRGRSLLRVEDHVSELDCVDADILNMTENWPDEQYAAFCDAGESYWINCQWDECSLAL